MSKEIEDACNLIEGLVHWGLDEGKDGDRKMGLSSFEISFNEHHDVYQNSEEAYEHDEWRGDQSDWVSEEDRKWALKNDCVWTITVHDSFPVSSCQVCGSSLEI